MTEGLIYTESLIGFGIGILGGLVGLILGSIRLPAMVSILKMDPSRHRNYFNGIKSKVMAAYLKLNVDLLER
jgi:hypothetical protein